MLTAWCFNHRLTPSLYRDDPWERNSGKYEPRALTSSFYGQATADEPILGPGERFLLPWRLTLRIESYQRPWIAIRHVQAEPSGV